MENKRLERIFLPYTLSDFKAKYVPHLREDMGCMAGCFRELIGGWTLQTFKQILDRATKNGQIPLRLYFDSAEEMSFLSNKMHNLKQLFLFLDKSEMGNHSSFIT